MISRRGVVQLGAASALASPALAQRAAAGTLRFVPQANLSILDPIFTLAAVTITHGYCVFDTLYGVDGQMQPRPQMAEGHEVSADQRTWLIRLRDGLRFHDGEPVRAQDCAASLQRWSRRDTFGQTLAAAVEAFEAVDDRTLRIRLSRPFPRLLDAIGKPHSSPAFIMPERLARTPPDVQVTEMVGSGPWRFAQSQYDSGSRAVYTRFDGYQPRPEAPDWTSGGKQVHFERMEWSILPDAATAAAALQAGEVDWWEQILPDLAPALARRRGVRVERSDPFGLVSVARFNHLHPPFNNQALRRAVLSAISQRDLMLPIVGGEEAAFRQCLALFPCGMPGVNEVGADQMRPPRDLDAARAAVRASGYAGERAVIINPTDFPSITPHGQLLADLMRRIGINVDLQEMDWGASLARRASREPVERGGWSLACTNWPSVSIANPAMNATIRGQGANGWAGWYENAEVERLTHEWLDAPTPEAANRTLDAIHRISFETVPTLPLGQFFHRHAHRDTLTGILPGSVAYFWNVRRA
ncbi:MAG: ABC transporter substrate-binding protein [Roseomonas sp.]|nr:ABC transporter substrate-binding protein [Roseomonas sp.]